METTTVNAVGCEVECLEISISKNVLENQGRTLLWTLSVYTLDNKPLQSQYDEGAVFRFRIMDYDWKKTIKRLLDENKIPYSTEKFLLDSIYRQPKKKIKYAVKDARILFGKSNAPSESNAIEEGFWTSLPLG